jgi:uncharacterized protein (DUF1697 family)
MKTFIGLLRGINVDGKNRLPMQKLRELGMGIGLSAVQTYMQSGNVVFQAEAVDPVSLATQIEERIRQEFGFSVAVFIRQPDEFKRILANNPFLVKRTEDPARLYVTFLYQDPDEVAWSRVTSPSGTTDEFARAEQVVYLFCPNGYGKTKLSNDFFERKLGVPATTRNWNTVSTLSDMAES